MKRHQKRHAMPKNWPIARKGTTFVVKSNSGNGVPVLVALRDMLKIAKTRKEVGKALYAKNVLLNGRPIFEDKNGIVLQDVLTIVPSKMNYRMGLSQKGKFELFEIAEKDASEKVSKINDKKILKGKKIQLNLEDGRNFISEIECKVNDSVIISFKDKKITKCLPLKEKANALVIAGKHAGMQGTISKIDSEKKMAEVKIKESKINVLIKQLMVMN